MTSSTTARPTMTPAWYRNAVIYHADVAMFSDSNGDGWGDLRGLAERLDHVRGLGATACWLSPFYVSPYRDGGYDVSDHLAVDPRFGDLGDFAMLVERADSLGLRLILDLVVQHTSIDHPWFQEARSSLRDSPYRDYYVWADEPEPTGVEPIFPGQEDSVWTWDEEAGQFYRHTFYHHEPDLDLANPRVREELYRIMGLWLRLGASGFRIDAAPYLIERARVADPTDDGLWLLHDMRRFVETRRPGAVLIGEVDVEPEKYDDYLGHDDRLHMLLDFWNRNHLFHALAIGEATPLVEALERQPRPVGEGQYATFLRNHDELDLEQLSEEARKQVLDTFAPEEDMRIYGRGIRRRMAPMLQGDEDHLALAHALMMSLPGSPVLRYGDELGMGDDLSRQERESVRTPMQWSDGVTGGFSAASPDDLAAPVISGDYGPERVNAYDQLARPDSLLAAVGDLARSRAGAPEIAAGECTTLDTGLPELLCLAHTLAGETVITVVNLADRACELSIPDVDHDDLVEILSDRDYRAVDEENGHRGTLELAGWGYRWFRVRTERDRR